MKYDGGIDEWPLENRKVISQLVQAGGDPLKPSNTGDYKNFAKSLESKILIL